jgi:RHS repeat-associated protein
LHVYGIANNLNSSRSQAFTYDQLNRILSAGTAATTGTYCWGYQYSYDAWGNLLSQAGWSPTYNSCTETTMGAVTANGNNQITGLSYDAAGNTLGDGRYTYTWDGESQMKTAAGVTYAYDGDGRRAAKVGSKLYWDGSGGEILAETDAAGNTLNEYIFFGGKRVAVVPASGSPLYYAEDLLGISRVMVQSNGTLCYDADFTPFGAEKSYTSTCPQNYKFEGKERGTETQNDDFGARYYTWRFGRWLSSDWSAVPVAVPYANLSNPQTLNLYSMVADDPESFADLDGHAGGGTTTSASCGNTAPGAAWACTSDSGGELIAGGIHGDREDASLATDADKAAAANDKSDKTHNKPKPKAKPRPLVKANPPINKGPNGLKGGKKQEVDYFASRRLSGWACSGTQRDLHRPAHRRDWYLQSPVRPERRGAHSRGRVRRYAGCQSQRPVHSREAVDGRRTVSSGLESEQHTVRL